MKTIRVKTLWDITPTGTFLSKEGAEATAEIPGCKTVHEITLKGDNGTEAQAALFIEHTGAAKRFSRPVCLITADSAPWAEEAAQQHFAKFTV